jgi:hypothetical protein
MVRWSAWLLAMFLLLPVLPGATHAAAAESLLGRLEDSLGSGKARVLGPLIIQSREPDIVASGHPDPCPALAAYTNAPEPMPQVGAAMQPGGHFDILAIGSGTMLESDTAKFSDSIPRLTAEALKAAAPQTDVTLTLGGDKGLPAAGMLKMIDAALGRGKFQLVLWQTGTVEAVKGLPVDDLRATLAEGAAHVHAAGGELVLIDSQYSRLLQEKANLAPYQAAMLKAGASPGVTLFHRFDLMQNWVDHGGIDLEHTVPADRLKTASLLRACLARALARLVLDGASGGARGHLPAATLSQ